MLLVPYAVERPPRRVPFITYGLVALNVLVFVGSVWVANSHLPNDKRLVEQDKQRLLTWVLQQTRQNANAPPSLEQIREVVDEQLYRHFDYGMIWRLEHERDEYVLEPHYTTVLTYAFIPNRPTWWGLALTHIFLHASLLHLLGNMLFLWLFGRALEDALGWWLFGLSYLVSGLAAAILQLIMIRAFSPETGVLPMLGASGAVSGVMGLFALRFYRTRIHVFYLIAFIFWRWGTFTIPSAWGIGLWVLQDVIGGVWDLLSPERYGGVAHWAHIGGFGLGLLYGLLIQFQAEGKSEYALADAEKALSQGQYQQAAQCAAQYLARHPHDGDAHLVRARSLVACGDSQGALPHFAQALTALLHAGRLREAGAVCMEADRLSLSLTLEPNLQFTLANRLAGAGEFAAAARAFRAFALAYPDEPRAAWALVKAAQILQERLNQPEEAQRLFALARERYPHNRWTQEM
ncbi:MAG: rhomboid family intramembrane serine protease [Abditibacteriales bacterium]|nr:rhomboid family intramembrane serine protease [Abditibacteriales bacterium]MDW8365722.1 rhomboid family intramembrane serine protease [Abditibacteriales bacterium]